MPAHAHLSNGGVDIHFAEIDGALVIRYWGTTLIGELPDRLFQRTIPNSDFDAIQEPGLLREHSRGWLGYPTISGHRAGSDWSTRFEVSSILSDHSSMKAKLRDSAAQLELAISAQLDKFGVLRLGYELTNLGPDYTLNELCYWLPLPSEANQTLDFAGRWSNERNPQRRDIAVGQWVRDSHEGRSGHNATIGQIALTERTNFAEGDAWSVALAWSGDSQYRVERTYEGATSIGASELLLPGEIILKSGESYQAPELVASFSAAGLDGLASNHHRHIRARANHPKSPRPLTLNMWEAIYFDHSEERVRRLVDAAADIGVERVVLDDGWFGSRRNDRSGLGDWQVSPEVWPNGLRPISDYVASKGMQFGLWFEGEMLNVDSQLFRKHPDWILSEQGRIPPTWRHELVLNLANPDAYKYILESVSEVVTSCSVKYIKWDHNRTLVDAGYAGKAASHRQTLAIYRLFDELKACHPGLEIESCASGGGRIDLGAVDHVDRFWTSDNNDALERQRIQRWTAQFLPIELLGTHVGPTPGHQTGRRLSLAFRALTALFGHAGIEWDITSLSSDELDQLRNWITYYKSARDLIHSGTMVRVDYPDQNHHLYGVVNPSQTLALFAYVQLSPISTSQPPRLCLTGLEPSRRYRVSIASPAGPAGFMSIKNPEWVSNELVATGSVIASIGLPAPVLQPAEGILIEVCAI